MLSPLATGFDGTGIPPKGLVYCNTALAIHFFFVLALAALDATS